MASTKSSDPIITLPNDIVVRPWQLSDMESSVKHMNNKAVWINMRDGIRSPYTLEDAEKWINLCLSRETDAPTGPWTLESGATGPRIPSAYAITIHGEAVGGIGLVFGVNVYRRTAELGYWLGEQHWGKGVMTAVASAFCAWAWDTFGSLVRLNSGCYDFNKGSAKVLEKIGFEYEGHRRDCAIKNGVIRGELMYGLLRPKQ